jgi:beta-glucosidase
MESIYVGYRYYSTSNVPVKYPFGFGLSYTSFEYSSIKTDREYIDKDTYLTLKVKVKNTGLYDGAEVIQIYIRNNCSNTFTPNVVLKNFEKVYLKKGEEKEVAFTISYEDFMRYDVSSGWVADCGDYLIFAGKNCEDLRLGVHVQVEGDGKKRSMGGLDTYFHPAGNHFEETQFENLYSRGLPPLDIDYKPIDLNTPLEFCAGTITGKLLFKVGKWTISKSNPGRDGFAARKALSASLGSNPIRSLVVMNDGTNLKTGLGIVKMMTGRFFSGLKDVINSLKE